MSEPRTIRELLSVASGWLAEQGVDEARFDTEVLLAHTLNCKRLDLYLDHDRPLDLPERDRFRGLMRRRGRREPVAYITGTRGFYGLDLEVAPGVLIPRPETEHLVEVGLAELDRLRGLRGAEETLRFADVGAGSGCVALALAQERPAARGLASDVSPAALRVARRNAEQLGLLERVSFTCGNLLGHVAPGSLDLIVSNPPYVTPDEERLLGPEILDHEPRGALFDSAGLPLTRALVDQARRALRSGGGLALETGFDKADLVAGFLEHAGFRDVRRVEDLDGTERVIAGRLEC